MRITAHSLTLFQRCRRQFILELTHRYLPWHPNTLLSACLRHGIYDLANSTPTSTCTSTAVNQFLSNCKYPGLDLPPGVHPYTIAMDCTAIIRTVLERLSRLAHSRQTEVPPVQLDSDFLYGFLSHQDLTGTLHRWQLVDYITTDTITRALHSWEVQADIALAHAPMILHLISVGSRRDSHRNSPWCRAYRSQVIANHIRFQKRSGQPLDPGTWKPFWYSDNPDNEAATWVDLMEAEGVFNPTPNTTELMRDIRINELPDHHQRNLERDLHYELDQIRTVLATTPTTTYPSAPGVRNLDFSTLPITHPSCDAPYTCPHQAVCYDPSPRSALVKSKLYGLVGARSDVRSDARLGEEAHALASSP